MHLSSIKSKKIPDLNMDEGLESAAVSKQTDIENVTQAIDQIKNIAQEKKIKPEIETEIKAIDKSLINSFNDLLDACLEKKEIKLKYELEKNVNLVKFERNRIEISFNDNLDKDFVKDLSAKLFEWTGERWIITFSKSKGEMSVKEKQKNKKEELINEVKNSEIYKTIIEKFPDAELTDVKLNKKED
jgi:DNA polymerase-3 subunit gamma/tau